MRRVLFIVVILALACSNAMAQDAKAIECPIAEKTFKLYPLSAQSDTINKIIKRWMLEKKQMDAIKKKEFREKLEEYEEMLKEYPNLNLEHVILLELLIEVTRSIN